jgi:hypothetical protein
MTARRTFACLALAGALALAGCKEDPPTIVQPGDPASGGDDYCAPPCSQDGVPPAPWDTLTWEIEEIDVGNPTLPAGIQSRMVREPDGDIHVAYLKLLEAEATCDIAVFAGGSAPNPTYQLRVATLTSGSDTWTFTDMPLNQVGPPDHVSARYGVDATLNSSGQLVVVVAAGGPGLAQCGSTDSVMCTLGGGCQAMATNSGECCTERSVACTDSGDCELDWCEDPNCTNAGPGDVGSWSAIARADNGTLGIAFTDVHNFWDQDGQNHQGLEFTEGGGVTGIRPWSSLGKYAALAYDANIPVVACTSYTRGGLHVFRRPTTNGDGNDWVAPDNTVSRLDVWDGYDIGERIQLEKAPDGTFGLLFHAAKDRNNYIVNDLVYCTSSDGGATWDFPCNKKLASGNVGAFPSLAYDAESVPYVVYRSCGGSTDCPASQDGLWFAWFDENQPNGGAWWRFIVHNEASSRSGLYNQLVVDPDTKEPTIAFQHLTRGSLVIARGRFN